MPVHFSSSASVHPIPAVGEELPTSLRSPELPTTTFDPYLLSIEPIRESVEKAILDKSLISSLVETAKNKKPALQDVKYWSGDPRPWRNGTDDSPIVDASIIALEEKLKAEAEAEDRMHAPTPAEHADRLHRRGVTAEFLVYLTIVCNLWDWKTWEVVQFLVKPTTERERSTGNTRPCFMDIPGLKVFSGPAAIFASHCWGGRWGDLVAAVCAGGNTKRIVWVDIFAVRQWPGNSADLDFRGVIQRTAATIVAVAPVEGRLAEDGHMFKATQRKAFLASDEYQQVARLLAFCRLWCLVEIFTTLDMNKPIIFRGAAVMLVNEKGAVLAGGGGGGFGGRRSSMVEAKRERERIAVMLQECAFIVNVEHAQCAVEVDRVRELTAIERASADRGGLSFVNKALAAALNTGVVSAQQGIVEVDNYLCGEPSGLRNLTLDKVEGAVDTVCAAGLVEVLDELLVLTKVDEDNGEDVDDVDMEDGRAVAEEVVRTLTSGYYPLWIACNNGRKHVVERLLQVQGVDVNLGHPADGCTPLYVACEKGHEAVVEQLLAKNTIDVNQPTTTDGRSPLYVASQNDHVAVLELLLAKRTINVNQALTTDGASPLFAACSKGHIRVVERLLSQELIDINQPLTPDGATPLFEACGKGNKTVVELLLKNGADITITASGWTPLAIAEAQGHEDTAMVLRRALSKKKQWWRPKFSCWWWSPRDK